MNTSPPGDASEQGPPAAAPYAPESVIPRYGDRLCPLDDDSQILRFGTWNMRGFPYKDSPKLVSLTNMIRDHQFTVLALNELNRNWTKVPIYHRPAAVLRQSLGPDTHTHIAYNRHSKSTSSYVYGGTAVCTIGPERSRVMEWGSDPTGLGRWCWQTHRGKHGKRVRYYSAYCPVQSTNPGSVYTQHLQYFTDTNHSNPSPLERFLEDLQADIQTSTQAGDLIVLGLDANFDLTTQNSFTEMTQTCQLVNPILSLPSKGHGALPPSRIPGSRVIDGIYISAGLQIEACGYLGTDDLPPLTDHACLWFDISIPQLYGYTLPPPLPPHAHRLQIDRPRTVAKFQALVHKILSIRRVPERVNKFMDALPTMNNKQRATHWMLSYLSEIVQMSSLLGMS